MQKKGFTLIELLVVVAIIAILVGILLPVLSKAKETAKKATCSSNLQQVAKALQIYADDYNDVYPKATVAPTWDVEYDNPATGVEMGWMRRLFGYIKDRNVYKCPSVQRPEGEFHYFLGTRAAYAQRRLQGYTIDQSRTSVKRSLIEFPSVQILGGDCNLKFSEWDCDRDDYTQQCLGWKDVVAANPDRYWDRWHDSGLNVIFADAHVNWYTNFVGNAMTFSYNDYKNWAEALPTPDNI